MLTLDNIVGIEVVIMRADIEHAIGHSWGGVNETAGGCCPERVASGMPAASSSKGIHFTIVGADIDDVVDHRRGGIDFPACRHGPQLFAVGGIESIDLM